MKPWRTVDAHQNLQIPSIRMRARRFWTIKLHFCFWLGFAHNLYLQGPPSMYVTVCTCRDPGPKMEIFWVFQVVSVAVVASLHLKVFKSWRINDLNKICKIRALFRFHQSSKFDAFVLVFVFFWGVGWVMVCLIVFGFICSVQQTNSTPGVFLTMRFRCDVHPISLETFTQTFC